jgi:hypothetical protein
MSSDMKATTRNYGISEKVEDRLAVNHLKGISIITTICGQPFSFSIFRGLPITQIDLSRIR